jgi:CheY-like chemotaxis protein
MRHVRRAISSLSKRFSLRTRTLRLIDSGVSIDLLFTDVVMPEMNGRKLADEAIRRRPELKVLFTTGYTRNAIVHNGLLDAKVHLLAEPYRIEQLANKLREALQIDIVEPSR